MKYQSLVIYFTLIILIGLIGCSKKQNEDKPEIKNLNLTKRDYYGCSIKNKNIDSILYYDTMYYEIIDDTLLLHLIMFKNCGARLKDSLSINNNEVNIFVTDTSWSSANCMCNFSFDYFFTNFGENIHFYCYYKNLWDADYILLDDLIFMDSIKKLITF